MKRTSGYTNAAVRSNIARLYIITIAEWFMLAMPIVFPFYKESGLSSEPPAVFDRCDHIMFPE